MKQEPGLLENLVRGDKVLIFDANGHCLGRFVFSHFENDGLEDIIQCKSDNFGSMGEDCFVGLTHVIIKRAECAHQWKRLDLFRTTEFHCKLCAAIRPFNIEMDEAA
jgi:hypothetical protein